MRALGSWKRAACDRLGLDGLTAEGAMFPLFVLFGLNAVDELDSAVMNVLLPEIRRDFGISFATLGLMLAVIALFNIVLAVPIGFQADRVRRLRLAQVGAGVWALGSFTTGIAPGPWAFTLSRVAAGTGKSVNAPAHNSLLADYYPPANRAGVYSVYGMANPVGLFLGPIVGGVLAAALGWRVPFLVFTIPTVVFVILSLRLREPVRGVHERIAGGAANDSATAEDVPPSWEEAWRVLNGVRTLRRTWVSLPFLAGGILAMPVLANFFYQDVLGVHVVARGFLQAAGEPFRLVGMLIGIPLATRTVRTDPRRLFRVIAIAGTLAAVGLVGFALAPNVYVAAGVSFAIGFVASIVGPGLSTIQSLLLPPRVRSFGFSIGGIWLLPGLGFLAVSLGVADAFGMRAGILVLAPVFLVGAYVLASAGSQVSADVRSNELAVAAAAEYRRQRQAGADKLLICRGVDVHYGPVQVLFDVDLDVRDGEILALLGTNGAGKSTLLKAISGVLTPSSGAIVFDGTDVTHATPQQILNAGLAYMPGGRAVFPTLSVAENLRIAAWSRLGDAQVDADVEDALDRFPVLRQRMGQSAGNLSGGEQQMLALSMAFLARPKLLAIDELSLGLAPTIVEQLLKIVRDIHAGGTTIVIVEQSVNVALTIAERAVFLEKGEIRFEGRTADLLDRPDVLRSVFLEGAAAALGRAAAPQADGTPVAQVDGTPIQRRVRASVKVNGAAGRAPEAPADVVLRTVDLSRAFGGIAAVDHVDLEVGRGEVLGVIGSNGAGKTTLFDLISGFLTADSGSVHLGPTDVTNWSPDARARARLGRSFQDARLFPSLTVREVVAAAHHRHLRSTDLISPALGLPDQRIEERLLAERVEELVVLVGLAAFADKFVGELSTGTRRIVDLAGALAHEPEVLLLDEPSSGIAQRETEALGELLLGVQRATGCSLLVIEHDMPLITAIADRLVALDLGAVIAVGSPGEVVNHPRVVESYLGSDAAAISRSGSPPIKTGSGPTGNRRRASANGRSRA